MLNHGWTRMDTDFWVLLPTLWYPRALDAVNVCNRTTTPVPPDHPRSSVVPHAWPLIELPNARSMQQNNYARSAGPSAFIRGSSRLPSDRTAELAPFLAQAPARLSTGPSGQRASWDHSTKKSRNP